LTGPPPSRRVSGPIVTERDHALRQDAVLSASYVLVHKHVEGPDDEPLTDASKTPSLAR
jgi:hypothetical protein